MATYICTHCGWEGERKKMIRGSKTLEVIIWSTVLIPGPFYSLWRRSGYRKECPHCGLPMLVKVTSDAGKLARHRFDLELGIVPTKKEKKPDDVNAFGNDQPAGEPVKRKPVNPDEW